MRRSCPGAAKHGVIFVPALFFRLLGFRVSGLGFIRKEQGLAFRGVLEGAGD